MADLKFTKSTDTEHEIKLDSHLVYATWTEGKAYGGQTAELMIGTAFVGDGAKIEIKGKSVNGKKLGKIKDVIKGNSFIGKLEIPEDIEFGDEVYYEVKLSKNGLSGESDRIPAFPPVMARNFKWSASEAARGDVVTLSTELTGLPDQAEVNVTIYEYDADGAHDRISTLLGTVKDEKVEVLWEYEYFADTDDVPTNDEMQTFGGRYRHPEYFFTVTVGSQEYGKEQDSGLLLFKDWVEISFLDQEGKPRAGEKYKVKLADGKTLEGELDDDGLARIEDVPPGPVQVEFPDSPGIQQDDGA